MNHVLSTLFCSLVFFISSAQALQVQGHRGARAQMPENTLPSFEAAIKAGADVLELDVFLTSDNECVIHHNCSLNEEICTYLDGSCISSSLLIKNLTLAQIKQIDAGAKGNPSFPKQVKLPKTTIPTLSELFTLIKNSSDPKAKTVQLNIEIKRDPRYPDRTASPELLAEKVISLVKEHGFYDRVYFSSFDPTILQAFRDKDPKVRLGFIFNKITLRAANFTSLKKGFDVVLKLATSLQVEVLSPDHPLVGDVVNVAALQQKGFKVIPWTVNSTEDFQKLSTLGVDGIITDDPESLITWLKNADVRSQEIK